MMSPSAQGSVEAAPGPHIGQSPGENPETYPEIAVDTDKLASCLGCRKRKLKCSRDLPSCTHCRRLAVACVYDAKKAKPGLRPGAIEALSQRIEALETAWAVSRQATPAPAAPTSSPNDVAGILAVLAQELHKLTAHATPAPPPPMNASVRPPSPSLATASLVTATDGLSPEHSCDRSDGHGTGPPRKRRRMVDSCGNPDIDLAQPLEAMEAMEADVDADADEHVDTDADANADTEAGHAMPTGLSSPGLPPPDVLQAVVNAYFVAVQPWIPVLHETHFRRRMHDSAQRPRLACILHAMVVAAAHYVPPEDVPAGANLDRLVRLAQRSRSHVLLSAMDSLSVESLQALIILAFHDIGSGMAARAWSIVASLTRTVDYLGLNVEDEDGGPNGSQASVQKPLLRPVTLLGPPHNWTEEEERRRVFWCALLLDRFCSVATGWNTGLAAADVHRRLPADGFFFHKEEPVLTPYMYGPPAAGPADACPADRERERERERDRDRDRAREPVESPASPPASTHSPTHRHAGNPRNPGNMNNVGAFAYCIEAAESLSRVVSTFLRQSVDFGDRQDVSRWLMRFKELDLRLVHWKMYLPQRWRDSNVSRQPALVNMDPNLTLAHITHNTSTILLHQRIAYPDPAWWTRIVKLPSFCSAETCQNAAVETAAITSKYLRYTAKHRPLASQFAFCVYISARVLLVHWRSEGEGEGGGGDEGESVDVLPEFWSLLRSLEDMDRRWMGRGGRRNRPSLAGHYAQQLKDLHRQCLASPSCVVDALDYTESSVQPKTRMAAVEAVQPVLEPPVQLAQVASMQPVQAVQTAQPMWPMQMQPLDQLSPAMATYPSATALADSTAAAYAAAAATASVVSVPTGHTSHSDDLTAISHLLLDPQFMDRDRVISFEDSFFAAPGRWT